MPRRPWTLLTTAVLATALASSAFADDAPPGPAKVPPGAEAPAASTAPLPAAPKPPKYEVLRSREDWSPLLATPLCERCDPSDRIKAVSIACGDRLWVNAGGQVRLRFEAWDDQGVGAIPGDDSWWLMRVLGHADLRLGRSFRVFAQGIWAEEDGRDAGPRPVDEDEGDLLDLFAEGWGPVGCVEAGGWAGRRELLFGKQRLVGPLDWGNTRRTFQGGGGWAKGSTWRLDAFWVQPVVVDASAFNEADDHADFAGAYFTRTVAGTTWDAYAFYLHRDTATWLGVPGEESRWTLGAACRGSFPGSRFDYDVEAAAQLGESGGKSIAAGMATAEVGWKPCVPCWEPRVAIGGDWASGDRDGPGGDVGTFSQLFPTGHLWFGWTDLIGRQNLWAARLTVTAKPVDRLTLRADLHAFWRASPDDAVYNAAGGVLRGPVGSSARAVGTEVSLQARFAIDRHWEVEAGWGHFMPGTFLDDTGPSEDTDFLYAQVTFTF